MAARTGLAFALALASLAAADVRERDLISRVRDYVAAYRPALSALVAEETYRQQLLQPGGDSKVLVSDWALVRSDDGAWIGFRDVWKVDGHVLPDRARRLDLLVGRGRPDWTTARQIVAESARHNITGRLRTFNSPHIALELLAADRSWCCRVKARRRDGSQPRQWLVEVEERNRPTLIRAVDGEPAYSRAEFVVDEASGAVVRFELRVGKDEPVTIGVTFSYDAALRQWLPSRMEESFRVLGAQAEGRARYENWRRFGVDTRLVVPQP